MRPDIAGSSRWRSSMLMISRNSTTATATWQGMKRSRLSARPSGRPSEAPTLRRDTGGDEIVILLPETKLSKAYNLFANRIKRGIEDRFANLSRGKYALTVTIGIASYPQDGENAMELILSADRALLAAKKEKHSRRIGCARMVPGALLAIP